MLKSRFSKLKNCQSGFSVLELLASSVAGLLVVILAGSMIQTSIHNYHSLEMKLHFEESVNYAAMALKNYLSMAVNLKYQETPPLTAFQNNIGKIRTYNLNDWTPSTGSGSVDTLAFFLRENLRSGSGAAPATGTARFPITSIYFQRPTMDKYGVLHIQSVTDHTSPLSPSASDLKIPGLVDFEILDVIRNPFIDVTGDAYDADIADAATSNEGSVSGVLIKVVIRNYFGNQIEDLKWCPQRFIAANPGCVTKTPYRDSEKTFLINIRNNILSRAYSQRTTGPNATLPVPSYRRSADTVYFLKPHIPIGVSR